MFGGFSTMMTYAVCALASVKLSSKPKGYVIHLMSATGLTAPVKMLPTGVLVVS